MADFDGFVFTPAANQAARGPGVNTTFSINVLDTVASVSGSRSPTRVPG